MKRLSIIFILLGLILIIFSVIEGLFIYLLTTILVLIIITYVSDFIKRRFPESVIGKLISKIFDFFHEIFENLLGWL